MADRGDRHDVLVVARNIRALRLRDGLTQGELAERLGVLPAQVSKWESGVHRLSDASLGRYTDFFDVSPDVIRGLGCPGAGLVGRSAVGMPIVDHLTVAGDGTLARHGTGEVGPVPSAIASRHPSAFLFRAPDASMSLLFPHDGLVLVDPDIEMTRGSQVGLVMPHGGDAALRRVLASPAGIALTTEPAAGAPTREMIPPDLASDVGWAGRAIWDVTLFERDY